MHILLKQLKFKLKMKKLISIFLLFTFIACHIEPELMNNADGLTYQTLRQKAHEENKPEQKPIETKDKSKKKDDSYLYTQPPEEEEDKLEPENITTPTSPQVVGRFWCDPDIKLNTIRQDVMTNKNYNK